MIIIFFLILVIIVYVYLLYPAILVLLSKKVRVLRVKAEPKLLKISIVIPVYNEEKIISDKISSINAQDYSSNLIEIIITSDGSTDNTVDIVNSLNQKNIKIFHFKKRLGKNLALNEILNSIDGEIVLFTDANAMFNKYAIKNLIKNFGDPNVGLVCGHLKYLKDTSSNIGGGEGLYFRYEAFIKKLESQLGVLPVVTGSIYAIRKELFTLLEPDIANDFSHPVKIGAKGYKVIYEPEAIVYEKATSSLAEEFNRRVRIVNRGFTAFGRYWRKYHLLKGLRGFSYISHKFLRWFVGFFLIVLFILNMFLLNHIFFEVMFALQLIFYALAVLGFFFTSKVFMIPLYFTMINAAALVGFFRYIFGKRHSVWNIAESTR